MPMPLARSLGAVMSATTAWTVPRLALPKPAIRREATNIHNALAKPRMSQPTQAKAMDTRMTGRRPMRSDKRPHNGAQMNCISEYEAPMRVTTVAVAPKLSA